ncbi:CBS domain-containing protein [Methanobacterium alcaliphilum]|uniref:CBS domain-containing protein n=1 Tax=Methanobacterium alcaliphilum TaxID=392018 RepID=UPI00200A69D0|nr:CBS domain-containing protein [Methanobacterium alcaliphilum]
MEEVMTSNPVTVSISTNATRVRSIFREEDFRCIPVVENDHLKGLITRGDMLNISATKSNIEARGIMGHPKLFLTPEMDLMDAAQKIISSEEIQSPVVESSEKMKLVGILSVVDILRSLIENGAKPNKKTLGEIKTKNVVYCDYRDPISQVWNKMDQSGFSGLPVMKKGKLIGIITRKDLITSGHTRIGKESDEIKRSIPVEKVMQTPPIVGTSDMLVEEAADLIVHMDIGRLPVVKNPVYVKKESYKSKESELIGIVSREDILKPYIS